MPLIEHPTVDKSTSSEQIEENEPQFETEVQTEIPVKSDTTVVEKPIAPVATDEVKKIRNQVFSKNLVSMYPPETRDVPQAREILEIHERPESSSSETTTSKEASGKVVVEGRVSTNSQSSDYQETAASSTAGQSTEIGRAGEEQVKIFEEDEEQGRKAVIVSNDRSLGYDIESEEDDGTKRYIEVKTTTSEELIPSLSINQFKKAIELGEKYFLYIVENFTDDTCTIYIIQNPADKISAIHFSSQWHNIADGPFVVKLSNSI